MHTTSTRPDHRRFVLELRKEKQRPGRLANPTALRVKLDRSIYTGNVLQEIARQQAAGNAKFSGQAFALKARDYRLFGRA